LAVVIVDKLISLEIQNKPEYVGGPIDIIEVTADKKIWHRKKAGCPIVLTTSKVQ